MKNKKAWLALKSAKDAVEQANAALESAMLELDDDMLDNVAGGIEIVNGDGGDGGLGMDENPFGNIGRNPNQPIVVVPGGNTGSGTGR